MIISSGSPVSPNVSFELGGAPVNYFSVNKITLDLETNKHDVLVAHFDGLPSEAVTDYIGLPVRFFMSSGAGRSQLFVGYVLYVEPDSGVSSPIVNNSAFSSGRVVCFGASVSMKGSARRVWENTSISRIAKELAAKYKFSVEAFDDSYRIPRIVQANESDWEFLSRVCDTYGYSMSVHGTHLSVWDAFQAIGRRRSYERIVPATQFAGATPGGIINLKGSFGGLTPDGESYRYRVTAIDSSGLVKTIEEGHNGTVESWSGLGETPKYVSHMTASAQSIAEAEKLIAAKRRKSFPFNIDVTIHAGAGIVPGGVVSVEGYGAKFEGLWYVKSVRHEIGGTSYTTNLKLAKDFNTTRESSVPPTELPKAAPLPTYVDDSWVASEQTVVTYV